MRWLAAGLVMLLAGVALGFVQSSPRQQGLPPMPYIYSGKVTVAGAPAPAGLEIVAKVGNYTSQPVTTRESGTYFQLKVAPPSPGSLYYNRPITFWAGGVQADQRDEVYAQVGAPSVRTLDLSFPRLPTGFQPYTTPTPTVPGIGGILLPDIGDPSVPALAWLLLLIGGVLTVVGLGVLVLRRRGASPR